jgi:hypothetical protein
LFGIKASFESCKLLSIYCVVLIFSRMCSVVAIMNYDNLQSSYYFQLMSTYHCSLGICERLCKSIIFSFVLASPCPVGIGLLALRTDTLFTPAPKRDRSFYLSIYLDVLIGNCPLEGEFSYNHEVDGL